MFLVQRILCRYRRNKKEIAGCIRNQLHEDISLALMPLAEYVDSFAGKQVKEGKLKAPLGAAGKIQ